MQQYLNDAGQYHRLDGPAVIWLDGNQEWYINGQRHREDGPAVIYKNGVIWPDGSEAWWANGKRHRIDGPAVNNVEWQQEWWVNGKRHRVDGPAVINYSNDTTQWIVDGLHIPLKELIMWMNECNITKDYKKWTDVDRLLFRLRF